MIGVRVTRSGVPHAGDTSISLRGPLPGGINQFITGLQVSSTLSALVLGGAVAAGCTVTTTGSDTPDASSTPVPTADGGASDAPTTGSGCDFGEPNDTREMATAISLDQT